MTTAARSPGTTPEHERTVLESGVRVITSTMEHTGAVSIMLLFGAGSRYETDALAGASHLFEHLLFKGTERRPTPRSISEVVEGVGGILNAYTDREVTGYWCKLAATHFTDGMDVLVDMVRNPLFREEDVAREKQVVFEEIRATHDSPQGTVDLMLDDLLWPGQPLGRDIAGSVESVDGVATDALRDYLRTQYVASNTVVAVAGSVPHDEVVGLTRQLLDGFVDGTPLPMHPAEDRLDGPTAKVQHRETEQAHLAFGLHGISASDPARYALRLLLTVLGGSMGSRLFEEVREKRGLAYSIHSGAIHFADAGALQVSSGVDPKRTVEAVKVIVEELAKIRKGVTAEEFSRAKELTKGRILMRMEESRAVASSLGAQELLLDRVRTVDEVLAEYDHVTLEEVTEVAERLLREDKLALSVVGPFESADEFEPLLRL